MYLACEDYFLNWNNCTSRVHGTISESKSQVVGPQGGLTVKEIIQIFIA